MPAHAGVPRRPSLAVDEDASEPRLRDRDLRSISRHATCDRSDNSDRRERRSCRERHKQFHPINLRTSKKPSNVMTCFRPKGVDDPTSDSQEHKREHKSGEVRASRITPSVPGHRGRRSARQESPPQSADRTNR